MRTSAQLTRLLVLSALLCAPLQSQPRGKRARRPAKPPAEVYIANSLDDPTDGEIEGRVYANKFFGLRLTFPEGWFALSEAGKQAVKERSKEKVKPLDREDQELVDKSFERTLNLLTVGQYLVAPPGQASGALLCMAEILPVLNMTPAQYLTVMRDGALPHATFKHKVLSDVTPERIAGEEFASIKIEIETSVGEVIQEHHVTCRRGFALVFTLVYKTEEQHELLSESLKSIALDKRATK